MSKAPKHPNQRDSLKQRNDEGGAPRSRTTTRKPRAAPKRKAETVLDSLSTEIPRDVMESSEGNIAVSPRPEQEGTPASARNLIAASNLNGEDQQGPTSEIRGDAEQQVQTVVFRDVPAPTEPNQGIASNLPLTSGEVEMQADQKQEPSQHRPMVHELRTDNREDRKGSFRTGFESTIQQAVRVWSPRLQAASDRVRGASGHVKVWAQERSVRRAHKNDEALGSANPLYILAAITLGIPALLLIPLVGMNPGVQEGTFTTVVTFLVISAFITAVVFESKRLADQSSDEEHP